MKNGNKVLYKVQGKKFIRNEAENVHWKTIIFVFVYMEMLLDFIKMPLLLTIFLPRQYTLKSFRTINYLLSGYLYPQ